MSPALGAQRSGNEAELLDSKASSLACWSGAVGLHQDGEVGLGTDSNDLYREPYPQGLGLL